MLNYYFVMQSTVTFLFLFRLSSITIK